MLAGIRHVIWDWNGTLLDDAWLCRQVMNDSLRQRDLPEISEEQYMEAFGFPVIDYYRRVGFDFSKESWEVAGSEFISGYGARRGECTLHSDVRRTLARLHQAGLEQSVLSAYQHDTLLEIVREHQLMDFFEHVLGIEDHYATGKVEQGLRLIASLKIDPKQVVLVGDTDHDHEVASAMGVRCVLIPRGNQPISKLECRGVPVIRSLEDLV